MECFLAAKQLRFAITTFCFGCVFLWILSGQYLDRQHRYTDASSTSRDHLGKRALEAAAGGQSLRAAAKRRLLEAREEINATQAMDETLHQMVYNTNTNSAGSSGSINRDTYNRSTAQVSKLRMRVRMLSCSGLWLLCSDVRVVRFVSDLQELLCSPRCSL